MAQEQSGRTAKSPADASSDSVESSIPLYDFLYKDSERISNDIINAPHGSLVIGNGTLLFLDHVVLKQALSAFSQGLAQQKPKTQEDRELLKAQQAGFRLFSEIAIPSAFILSQPDKVTFGGTIKDTGMQEIISTYSFRHGSQGIADIYVIGIKEDSSTEPISYPSPMFATSTPLLAAMRDLIFPGDTIRVTPIAIFRKLFD